MHQKVSRQHLLINKYPKSRLQRKKRGLRLLKNLKKQQILGEVASFFALLRFFVEPQDFINYLNVREQHPSATVPFNAQAIQDIFGVLACSDTAGKFFPFVADQFAAGEASHGNNHFLCGSPIVYL
jgi:hypothetical protein